MPDEIDTLNRYGVAVGNAGIVLLMPPRQPMTSEQALVLAAYIVALSEGGRKRFLEVLDAVEAC